MFNVGWPAGPKARLPTWLPERDGAHWSPWPRVPGANTMVGRSPLPVHGRCGSNTVPVTGVATPSERVEPYVKVVARAPVADDICATGWLAGRESMTVPAPGAFTPGFAGAETAPVSAATPVTSEVSCAGSTPSAAGTGTLRAAVSTAAAMRRGNFTH